MRVYILTWLLLCFVIDFLNFIRVQSGQQLALARDKGNNFWEPTRIKLSILEFFLCLTTYFEDRQSCLLQGHQFHFQRGYLQPTFREIQLIVIIFPTLWCLFNLSFWGKENGEEKIIKVERRTDKVIKIEKESLFWRKMEKYLSILSPATNYDSKQ